MSRVPFTIPARAATQPALTRASQSKKVSTELPADAPAEESRGSSAAVIEPSGQSATAQVEADPSTSAAKFARANLKTRSADEPDTTDKATDDDPKPSGDIATEDASTIGVPPKEDDNSPSAKTALELSIDRCTALGDTSDTMVSEKWAKRAAPILAASLNFLAEYKAATEAEREAVRKTLKAKSGVSRQPNVENLPLIAVYMCVSCADKTRTKKQRKAWGRFKTVVAVAAAASVVADSAAQWLEKKSLNSILAEWRDMQKAAGKATRKSPVPKALQGYTHLAAALAKESEFHTLAKAELAKADHPIAKAMSEVTGAAAASTAGAMMPAEEASANA